MADYKDLNDYEVMYLVEENDENAKEILFCKYRPLILKIAHHYKKEAKACGLEIDDLVQEAYIGLYYAIQNYDASNDALFYTYAIISIRSKILNCIKGKGSTKHRYLNQGISLYQTILDSDGGMLIDSLEDKSALLPHLIAEENEVFSALRDFLLALDFPQSCVFELRMNGFQNKDISELLEIPLKKVSNLVFRIRNKLKIYLKEKYRL